MSREDQQDTAVRLDKWLWAARFFKTRGLASEAIKGGKVHVNGQRAKPSKKLQLGDCLQIRRHHEELTVQVTGLSERRGPAREAALLYRETPESIARREDMARQRKLVSAMLAPPQRPSKKDRRDLRRLKGRGE